jgi:hypothetical protein
MLKTSPAARDMISKFKKNKCKKGIYCGDFAIEQFLLTDNFAAHTIGGFCANITPKYEIIEIKAWNTWGLESMTRWPEIPFFPSSKGNRRNLSVQQMISNLNTGISFPPQYPKSTLENRASGVFKTVTLIYNWSEENPCCK